MTMMTIATALRQGILVGCRKEVTLYLPEDKNISWNQLSRAATVIYAEVGCELQPIDHQGRPKKT